MDFSNVKSITIPEGDVASISVDGVVIWQATKVVTITFCLAAGAEPYAVIKTDDNGKLPNYPETPTKEGYIFAGWYTSPTDFTAVNKVTLTRVFFEDTTVYPYYIVESGEGEGEGGGDSDNQIFYDGYVDDAEYVYYRPPFELYQGIYAEFYNSDKFFNDFQRDETKFYIELFAFAKANGDFADTENGRHYFCDGANDAPVVKIDPEGEDLDGDGISDTLITIREGYCHSTDIAVDFGGGSWERFIETIDPNNARIVDCLNDNKPYYLRIYDGGYGDIVVLEGKDGEILVVGGRENGKFVAVYPDDMVFHGTAYEVLPIDEYYDFVIVYSAKALKRVKKGSLGGEE